uniref:Uncharacterized protein n=1 Tax=Siphoviridae sp. ctDiR9 TaxID=2825388 RepID=A0A8S5PQX0_9CAUD|nr:MAG TPA: hypothetical protein [Siphoviridae sp. ctDiR9]
MPPPFLLCLYYSIKFNMCTHTKYTNMCTYICLKCQ